MHNMNILIKAVNSGFTVKNQCFWPFVGFVLFAWCVYVLQP
jgi:hypothetical protein